MLKREKIKNAKKKLKKKKIKEMKKIFLSQNCCYNMKKKSHLQRNQYVKIFPHKTYLRHHFDYYYFRGLKKEKEKKEEDIWPVYTKRFIFWERKERHEIKKSSCNFKILVLFLKCLRINWPYGGYFACPFSLKENERMWERHYEWERFFLRVQPSMKSKWRAGGCNLLDHTHMTVIVFI